MRSLRQHPAQSSQGAFRHAGFGLSASAAKASPSSASFPPNKSFKPTPCRGFVETYRRAGNTGSQPPRSARLNSGVSHMKQLAKAHVDNQPGDSRFDLLKRWTYAMIHCYEAKEFIRLAEETHKVHPKSSLDEVFTQQALFRGFLVSYAKCFGGNGSGKVSLDPGRVFASGSIEMTTHERIIELRNKFAAHNDDSGLDEVVIDIKESEEEIFYFHNYGLANPLHEYPGYKNNISTMEIFIVDKLNQVADKIQKETGKTLIMGSG